MRKIMLEISESEANDRPEEGDSWFNVDHIGGLEHGEIVHLTLFSPHRIRCFGRVHIELMETEVETLCNSKVGSFECPCGKGEVGHWVDECVAA